MTRPSGLSRAAARAVALALPEATEGAHMGHPDFRVRGKIFASMPAKGLQMNMRATPANLDALTRADPRTYRDAWGGRWLGVDLGRISRPGLRALLVEAWTLVVPGQPARAASPRPASRRVR
jgi:hypothetical protein